MRVGLIYDRLFPYTVERAERWCRTLGQRLAATRGWGAPKASVDSCRLPAVNGLAGRDELWSQTYWHEDLGGLRERISRFVQHLCRIKQGLSLEDVVDGRVCVASAQLAAGLRRALRLLRPLSREGYGVVVVEASAHASPTVDVYAA